MENNSQIDQIRRVAQEELTKLLPTMQMPLFSAIPLISKPFTETELKCLIDIVILNYLNCWLETDPNAKQTINSFLAKPFLLRSEQQLHLGKTSAVDIDTAQLKRIRNIEKKLIDVHEAQIRQAKREGRGFKPLPEKGNKGRFYDFVTLQFLRLLDKKPGESCELRIYELLVDKKDVLRLRSEKKSNASLYDAYQKYEAFFYRIKKTKSDREYVTSCIQIFKLETAYRFILSAKVAKYLSLNCDADKNAISKFWFHFWGREETKMMAVSGNIQMNMFDILDYDILIKCLFCEDEDSVFNIAQRTRIWRELLTQVFQETINRKRVPEQPSWTDEDFFQAAKFFKEDYPIIESFEPLDLGEDFDGEDSYCYDRIREIYKVFAKEGRPLHELRESRQGNRKLRNQRSYRKLRKQKS